MRYAVVLVVALALGAGPAASQQEGHLQPGSDPSVLPGPILIADEDNDRIILPSDSNEFAPGRYVTADYSKPGQLVIFDGDGKVRWRYKPTGPDALDHPSLAIVLPNGMVAANDDANHRVIVVDPKTNRVVWQYGVTGTKGREPGLLNTPDGIDLAPPYSLLMQHAQTMGRP